MDAPQPELTIDWRHDGFQVLRIFVQDPLDLTTRERLMARVMTFRDVQDLATLRSAVEAIAQAKPSPAPRRQATRCVAFSVAIAIAFIVTGHLRSKHPG